MSTPQTRRHLAAERQLGKELEKHKGRWVAVRDHHIVACADNDQQLLAKTRDKDIDRYFRVTSGSVLL